MRARTTLPWTIRHSRPSEPRYYGSTTTEFSRVGVGQALPGLSIALGVHALSTVHPMRSVQNLQHGSDSGRDSRMSFLDVALVHFTAPVILPLEMDTTSSMVLSGPKGLAMPEPSSIASRPSRKAAGTFGDDLDQDGLHLRLEIEAVTTFSPENQPGLLRQSVDSPRESTIYGDLVKGKIKS